MPGTQYVALSGMRSRLDELDRLASDIANVGTSGYKSERASNIEADRAQFESVLSSAIDTAPGTTRLDARAGTIAPTGRDLDFAIESNGFFSVQTAAGVRYTRNGHFNARADGTLVTEAGDPVLGANGPIVLGPGKVSAAADGTITADGKPVGKLAIVAFDDPSQLAQEGSTLFRADTQTPRPVAQPLVKNDALEQSNASVVERIAELTSVNRSFEALQKAVSLVMNDVEGRAIDTLGKR